jgi:hypothetical protein
MSSNLQPGDYQLLQAAKHVEGALVALRQAWRFKRSSPTSRHIEAAAQDLKRAQAALKAAELGSGYEPSGSH